MKPIVPKGTRATPNDEQVEREFTALLARAHLYQPEYLDVILVASQYGFRYMAVKAVCEFWKWGAE